MNMRRQVVIGVSKEADSVKSFRAHSNNVVLRMMRNNLNRRRDFRFDFKPVGQLGEGVEAEKGVINEAHYAATCFRSRERIHFSEP